MRSPATSVLTRFAPRASVALVALAALFTAAATATPAATADEKVLTGAEIVALMSGRQVSGYSYRRSSPFDASFSPGRDVEIDAGLFTVDGEWRVAGNRLCLRFPSMPRQNQCGSVVRIGNGTYEVRDGGRAIQRFETR